MKSVQIGMAIVALVLLAATSGTAQVVEVTGINAVHRNGQTFVTWNDAASGEPGAKYRYSLYRSSKPITEDTLGSAGLVQWGIVNNSAKLFGSDFWPNDRLDPTKPTAVIEQGGKPLPLWSGLAVHTAKAAEEAFYAVVATDERSKPLTKVTPGKSATVSPVTERVAPIQPIKIADSKERGASAAQTSITGQKGLPLRLWLHGSNGRGGGADDWGDYYVYFGTELMGYRDGMPGVFSVDERRGLLGLFVRDAILHPNGREAMETYWFGYLCLPQWWPDPGGSPRAFPFTEQRLLWILSWVAQRYGVDVQRISLAGSSMGGWGATTFGLRHPGIFAAIYAFLPRPRQRDLPRIAGLAPGQRALMPDGKTDYLERMDMVKFVSEHHEDLPFMAWSIGRRDEFAPWRDQVDLARAMLAARHGFAFAWSNSGHGSEGAKPMEKISKYYENLARNVSYPAFSNSSIDDNLGNGDPKDGDGEGGINLGFIWKNIADEPDRWAVRLSNDLARAPMTVDVTPRRSQKFKAAAGQRFKWSNSLGGSGETTADQWGIVTVDGVTLYPGREALLTISRM